MDESEIQKKCTIQYQPTYEINKNVIRDFSKILVAINYIDDIPHWKTKTCTFKQVKSLVQFLELLMRKSLCFPVMINGKKINRENRIGRWIFTHLKIAYPNPIYKIFPPHFGVNHIKFMELIMTSLNATGMCKLDWELLLHFSDNLPDDENKKMFKEIEHIAMNSLYESFLAEKYYELKIRAK